MQKAPAILAMLCSLTVWGQSPLSLKDAVRTALESNKSIEASSAAQQAAESKVQEARGGFLPKVNYSESWTRSDNPVFVFSSLLTQHQFGEQNFLLGPLNRPDFLNNFQSLVTADQTLFDAGQTKHAVRSAGLTKDIADEDHRLTQMEVIAGVVRAYYDAVLSAEEVKAADQARALGRGRFTARRERTLRRHVHRRGCVVDSRTPGAVCVSNGFAERPIWMWRARP